MLQIQYGDVNHSATGAERVRQHVDAKSRQGKLLILCSEIVGQSIGCHLLGEQQEVFQSANVAERKGALSIHSNIPRNVHVHIVL